MKLTGKAKEAFEEWLRNSTYGHTNYGTGMCYINESAREFLSLQSELQNTVIIEFFDSVKIYISINYVKLNNEMQKEKGFQSLVSNKHLSTMFRVISTRQEATEKAIERANEIYNEI
jgi:hypothetical protein